MRVGYCRAVAVAMGVGSGWRGREHAGSSRTAVGEFRSQHLAAVEDEAIVGDIFHEAQIVRGGDHGLTAIAPADQKVDDLALTARVERGGGFVEQQDFRDRAPGTEARATRFFSPPGEAMGRAIAERRRSPSWLRAVFDVAEDFGFRPLELERGEVMTSSKTVGLKSWASGFWKTRPTRFWRKSKAKRSSSNRFFGQSLRPWKGNGPGAREARARQGGAGGWICPSR